MGDVGGLRSWYTDERSRSGSLGDIETRPFGTVVVGIFILRTGTRTVILWYCWCDGIHEDFGGLIWARRWLRIPLRWDRATRSRWRRLVVSEGGRSVRRRHVASGKGQTRWKKGGKRSWAGWHQQNTTCVCTRDQSHSRVTGAHESAVSSSPSDGPH